MPPTAEELEAQAAARGPIPEPGPSAVASEPEGRKTAVIVAGGSEVPKADIVIVVEHASLTFRDEPAEAGGDPVRVSDRKLKKQGYPAGAQTYLRYDPEVAFPKDAAEVMTMGVDVQQHNFAGFTKQLGLLNVGPAHPAYAAANLAYQRGATHIRIVGLSAYEKERLQPYFDGLATDPAGPAQVAVTLD